MSASGRAKPPDPVELAFGGLGCDTGQSDFENNLEELEQEEEECSTIDEDSQGESSEWQVAQRKSVKRKGKSKSDEAKRVRSDIKVILRFQNPCTLNPLKVSEAIYKLVGDVYSVKTLKDGNLLVICRDRDQRMGLMQCKNLLGKSVKPQDWEERGKIMAVISGVSTDLSDEDIRGNIKGIRVTKVKRLPVTRNGTKGPSLSVLLILDEAKMPERVMIGYVSYMTRPYIPPPTRCYKCQRYGHISTACKSKLRCARCGGDHEYGQCEEGAKVKCCNCGGEHSAAYKGCQMHRRAVQVQNVKVKEKVTYAEAIKRVDKENKEKSVVTAGLDTTPHRFTQPQEEIKCCRVKEDSLIVNKKMFIAFMVEVVNCSAQTERRMERVKIIIGAAEKYLDIKDLTVDLIHNMLMPGIPESQTPGNVTPGS